jgi:hypothetical protein
VVLGILRNGIANQEKDDERSRDCGPVIDWRRISRVVFPRYVNSINDSVQMQDERTSESNETNGKDEKEAEFGGQSVECHSASSEGQAAPDSASIELTHSR